MPKMEQASAVAGVVDVAEAADAAAVAEGVVMDSKPLRLLHRPPSLLT